VNLGAKSELLKKYFHVAFDPNKPLNFRDIMDQIHYSIKGSTLTMAQFTALQQTFGRRGSRAVMLILNNYDKWNKSIALSRKEIEGVAKQMGDIRMDTLLQQAKIAQRDFQAFAASFAKNFTGIKNIFKIWNNLTTEQDKIIREVLKTMGLYTALTSEISLSGEGLAKGLRGLDETTKRTALTLAGLMEHFPEITMEMLVSSGLLEGKQKQIRAEIERTITISNVLAAIRSKDITGLETILEQYNDLNGYTKAQQKLMAGVSKVITKLIEQEKERTKNMRELIAVRSGEEVPILDKLNTKQLEMLNNLIKTNEQSRLAAEGASDYYKLQKEIDRLGAEIVAQIKDGTAGLAKRGEKLLKEQMSLEAIGEGESVRAKSIKAQLELIKERLLAATKSESIIKNINKLDGENIKSLAEIVYYSALTAGKKEEILALLLKALRANNLTLDVNTKIKEATYQTVLNLERESAKSNDILILNEEIKHIKDTFSEPEERSLEIHKLELKFIEDYKKGLLDTAHAWSDTIASGFIKASTAGKNWRKEMLSSITDISKEMQEKLIKTYIRGFTEPTFTKLAAGFKQIETLTPKEVAGLETGKLSELAKVLGKGGEDYVKLMKDKNPEIQEAAARKFTEEYNKQMKSAKTIYTFSMLGNLLTAPIIQGMRRFLGRGGRISPEAAGMAQAGEMWGAAIGGAAITSPWGAVFGQVIGGIFGYQYGRRQHQDNKELKETFENANSGITLVTSELQLVNRNLVAIRQDLKVIIFQDN